MSAPRPSALAYEDLNARYEHELKVRRAVAEILGGILGESTEGGDNVHRLAELTRLEMDRLQDRNKLYAETLHLMISYLGHQDQDANHEWMVKKMRDALNGIHPGAAIEAQLREYDMEIK